MLVNQLCPTLCDSMDCSLPGSSIHGILQARILEWVAIPFSRGLPQPRDWTQVSCIAGKFFTFWATRDAPQVPMGGSRKMGMRGVPVMNSDVTPRERLWGLWLWMPHLGLWKTSWTQQEASQQFFSRITEEIVVWLSQFYNSSCTIHVLCPGHSYHV